MIELKHSKITVKRTSMWSRDFLLLHDDKVLAEATYSSGGMEARLRIDAFHYTITYSIANEVNIYDGVSGEEICFIEPGILLSNAPIRLRDYPDLRLKLKKKLSFWKSQYVLENDEQDWIQFQYNWKLFRQYLEVEVLAFPPSEKLSLPFITAVCVYVINLYNSHN